MDFDDEYIIIILEKKTQFKILFTNKLILENKKQML